MQTVITAIEVAPAFLDWDPIALVIPHFGQALLYLLMAGNGVDKRLGYRVLGFDPRCRGLRVQIFEPTVGIEYIGAVIIVCMVDSLRVGVVNGQRWPFDEFIACRRTTQLCGENENRDQSTVRQLREGMHPRPPGNEMCFCTQPKAAVFQTLAPTRRWRLS